jgi:tetratricopeptide (TPR) repeat protein
LANTGRCLLEIEQDVERAREFLDEAERLAATLNLRVIELDWGKALTARWDGDLDAAHAMTSRAIELARLREDRWRELECLVWLAKIDLERGRLEDVGVDCECITDVIRRISDLRAPIGEALGALAHYKQADASAQRKLDNALMRLRAFDDKANLAYVLNEYAAAQLQRGDYDHARILAQESLAAAGAVRRTTELAVSNALLLSASVAAGDDASSSTHLAQLSSLGNGQPLSARAKTFLNSAYERMPRSFKRSVQR